MAVSSCTFYDDYIEHAIEDIFIFPDFIIGTPNLVRGLKVGVVHHE